MYLLTFFIIFVPMIAVAYLLIEKKPTMVFNGHSHISRRDTIQLIVGIILAFSASHFLLGTLIMKTAFMSFQDWLFEYCDARDMTVLECQEVLHNAKGLY